MMGKPLRGAARETRAICALMRAETKPGADGELEALLRDFSHQVRAEEPGCDAYVVTRMIGSRTHFAVHARFKNMAAFNRHAKTEHLERAMPRLTALLATPVSMEIFFAV